MSVEQKAVSGFAAYPGIPDCDITWKDSGNADRSLTVFTEISKTKVADRTTAEGNDGEVVSRRRRNKRIQLRFSARPIGTTKADAITIGKNLPNQNSLCTITCATDAEVNTPVSGSSVVDDVSARYTPDGDLIVDFTVTNWIGKVFAVAS